MAKTNFNKEFIFIKKTKKNQREKNFFKAKKFEWNSKPPTKPFTIFLCIKKYDYRWVYNLFERKLIAPKYS